MLPTFAPTPVSVFPEMPVKVSLTGPLLVATVSVPPAVVKRAGAVEALATTRLALHDWLVLVELFVLVALFVTVAAAQLAAIVATVWATPLYVVKAL